MDSLAQVHEPEDKKNVQFRKIFNSDQKVVEKKITSAGRSSSKLLPFPFISEVGKSPLMEPIELMEICEDDEASDTANGDTDLEQSFLGGATVQKRLEMFFLSFFTLIRDLS